MTLKKRIEPVGINRGKLRGFMATAQRSITNIALCKGNENLYIGELFGAIFDLFYAPTGCTYDEFLDEMRILFKDIFDQDDMEGL